MAAIVNGRMTADHKGEITLFIIGMTVNNWFAIGKWLPVFRAMGRMLNELYRDPDSGFLGHELCWRGLGRPVLIQYWRSFDALEGYASADDRAHKPAWAAFNRAARGNRAVGIFHETYGVNSGASETIYSDTVPFGLGKVSGLVAATGSRQAARDRMRNS